MIQSLVDDPVTMAAAAVLRTAFDSFRSGVDVNVGALEKRHHFSSYGDVGPMSQMGRYTICYGLYWGKIQDTCSPIARG
jgi:hypothetical protein